MRSKMKWVIPFLLVLIVAGLYLYPIPRVPFNEVYAKAEESESVSLSAFRINHPPSLLEVNGVE